MDETRDGSRRCSPHRAACRSRRRCTSGTRSHRTCALSALIGLMAWPVAQAQAPPEANRAGPEIRFEHLLPEDGLSNATAYSLLQDRTGFLWIGTEGGLNRYDGYTFETFRHDPNAATSLASDDISFLIQDASGWLWLATWGGGLDRFDPTTGSFLHFRGDPSRRDRLQDDRIQHLFEDSEGVLWIGTYSGGLSRFDAVGGDAVGGDATGDERTTGTFTTYRHDPEDPSSLCHDRVWRILEDTSGAYWVATGRGLCLFDRSSGTFERFLHDPGDPTSLSDDVVRTLYVDSGGALWAGTNGGLNRFDRLSKTFERFLASPGGLSHNVVTSVFEDSRGTFWVGTRGGGLNVLDRTSGAWQRYRHDPKTPSSLSDDDVRTILEDRSGLLWVATRQGGLNKLDLKPAKFETVTGTPRSSRDNGDLDNADNLSGGRVSALAEDVQSRLWIATSEGLDRYDPTSSRFDHFRHDDTPASLPSNDVHRLLIDDSGVLWIGTASGLHRFDPASSSFSTHLLGDDDTVEDDQVTALFEDRAGDLWVGRTSGLYQLDRERRLKQHFHHVSTDPGSLSESFVTAVFEDSGGTLWVGTHNGGVHRLDVTSGGFQRFANDPRDASSLSNNRVSVIYQQGSGSLWVGTSNGLNEMRPDGSFRRLLEEDGLPHPQVAGIFDDGAGRLWLATGGGLSRFDPGTRTFRTYTTRDGLQSDQFYVSAALKRRDGRLCFGGSKGYSCFDPRQVVDNPHVPPVVLTDFQRLGESFSPGRAPWTASDIQLSHTDDYFAFEFAALDYTRPEYNLYRYRLEGFDREWVEAGSRRSASYANVPPSDYVFRVQGSNSDQVWNQVGLTVNLSITPPYWQTAWFRVLAALLLATAVGGAYNARVRHLKRREQKLARRVEDSLADLRRSEERYRLLFERNLAGVVRVTVDGRILECNEAFARILGYLSPEECRTQHVLDLSTALDDKPSLADRLGDDGTVVSYESSVRTRDGSMVAVLWNASLVPGDGDEPSVVEGTAIDVSERRRIEEGLRRAQKLESLGVLAGGIAHDFNNLLMSIMGNAELARRDLDQKSPIHPRLDRIETASGRAAELAKQMLAYSGKGDFIVTCLDFSSAVRDMANLLDGAVSKKAWLVYELESDLPVIEADAGQIEQIVMSLVTNASEALGSAGGAITIRTGSRHYGLDDLADTYLDDRLPAGRYVFLEVADEGSGMDEDLQLKIFDPFFTTKFTGRGLGLAAVLGIVRGHRGAIKIDSAPGRGSTFTVLFPASTPESAEALPEPEVRRTSSGKVSRFSHSETVSRSPPSGTRSRLSPSATKSPSGGTDADKSRRDRRGIVLVVDDDEFVRRVAQDMLSTMGFEVLTAGDGQEGVEVFRRRAGEIELVVLDLSMPRMSGEEAFGEIRKTAPGARVILASGYDEQESTRRFAGRGLSGFIQKPYRLTNLEEKIRQVLENA